MNNRQQNLIDNAPEFVAATCGLMSWSENYDYPSPGTLYLDLIGYSEEEFGAPMCEMSTITQKLGYLELDMLADALKEYARRPQDVYAFVSELMSADEEEETEIA